MPDRRDSGVSDLCQRGRRPWHLEKYLPGKDDAVDGWGSPSFGTRGLLRRTARLVVTLFRQVRFEEICVHTMFGLEDPADTGMVYGFLTPVLAAARARRLDVDCRPMFTETGWKGSVRATIRVRPLSLLAVLAVFLVSPPVIRALEVAWHSRK